jgi:hypothetical protein
MSIGKRELVFEDKVGLVYWDWEIQCIVLELKQCDSTTEYRPFMERVLQETRDRGSTKLLADMSQMSEIGVDDLLWTETDWFVRLKEAGVRHVAVVSPEFQDSYISSEKLTDGVDPNAS